MSALANLIEFCEENKICSITAQGYGSGDEGTVELTEVVNYEDAKEYDAAELDELVENAMMESDFNYYDGDGGELDLVVDMDAKTVTFTPAYPVSLIARATY